MDVLFKAKFKPNIKSLIRNEDSPEVRKRITSQVEDAKKFFKIPVINKILGNDIFILERKNGKNFNLTMTHKDPKGRYLGRTFCIRPESNDFLQCSCYEIIDMLATFACQKKGIMNKYPHEITWLDKLLKHISEKTSN